MSSEDAKDRPPFALPHAVFVYASHYANEPGGPVVGTGVSMTPYLDGAEKNRANELNDGLATCSPIVRYVPETRIPGQAAQGSAMYHLEAARWWKDRANRLVAEANNLPEGLRAPEAYRDDCFRDAKRAEDRCMEHLKAALLALPPGTGSGP